MRALLDGGADPRQGCPLFYAIEAGELEIVKLLVERGAAVDEEVHAKPMLVWATSQPRGGDPIAEYLIERGARVDYVDYDDWHALCWAVRRPGRLDLVQRLVERGALACLLGTEFPADVLRVIVENVVTGGDAEIEAWLFGEIERALTTWEGHSDGSARPRGESSRSAS